MYRAVCCFAAFAAISGIAQAAVSAVGASPSGAPIEMTRNTTVSTTWIVNADPGTAISSVEGVFRTRDGKVLDKVAQPLNATASMSGIATVAETVSVPGKIAVRAQLVGESLVIYERRFADGARSAGGELTLHIAESARVSQRSAGNNSGAGLESFAISRLHLGFSNGQTLARAVRGAKLTATMRAGYSSNGFFDGTWLVAGPNPGKQPEFRTLGSVRQLLADGGELTLESPILPTDADGVFYVRLEIVNPAVEFEEPELRYIVAGHKN